MAYAQVQHYMPIQDICGAIIILKHFFARINDVLPINYASKLLPFKIKTVPIYLIKMLNMLFAIYAISGLCKNQTVYIKCL